MPNSWRLAFLSNTNQALVKKQKNWECEKERNGITFWDLTSLFLEQFKPVSHLLCFCSVQMGKIIINIFPALSTFSPSINLSLNRLYILFDLHRLIFIHLSFQDSRSLFFFPSLGFLFRTFFCRQMSSFKQTGKRHRPAPPR